MSFLPCAIINTNYYGFCNHCVLWVKKKTANKTMTPQNAWHLRFIDVGMKDLIHESCKAEAERRLKRDTVQWMGTHSKTQYKP